MAVLCLEGIQDKPHPMQCQACGISTGFSEANQKKQAIRVFSGPP
jgi:hypothetical protein